MEILFIILAFFVGLVLGALAMKQFIQYALRKQAEKMAGMFGSGDPMDMVTGLFDQLSEAKKNA